MFRNFNFYLFYLWCFLLIQGPIAYAYVSLFGPEWLQPQLRSENPSVLAISCGLHMLVMCIAAAMCIISWYSQDPNIDDLCSKLGANTTKMLNDQVDALQKELKELRLYKRDIETCKDWVFTGGYCWAGEDFLRDDETLNNSDQLKKVFTSLGMEYARLKRLLRTYALSGVKLDEESLKRVH